MFKTYVNSERLSLYFGVNNTTYLKAIREKHDKGTVKIIVPRLVVHFFDDNITNWTYNEWINALQKENLIFEKKDSDYFLISEIDSYKYLDDWSYSYKNAKFAVLIGKADLSKSCSRAQKIINNGFNNSHADIK